MSGPGRGDALKVPGGRARSAASAPARGRSPSASSRPTRATCEATWRRSELRRIHAAGIERVHFAWAGPVDPERPHYYRLHGPTVLIEYDNTQNDANHIHSVWHDPRNDFGADLLGAHYRTGPHRA